MFYSLHMSSAGTTHNLYWEISCVLGLLAISVAILLSKLHVSLYACPIVLYLHAINSHQIVVAFSLLYSFVFLLFRSLPCIFSLALDVKKVLESRDCDFLLLTSNPCSTCSYAIYLEEICKIIVRRKS